MIKHQFLLAILVGSVCSVSTPANANFYGENTARPLSHHGTSGLNGAKALNRATRPRYRLARRVAHAWHSRGLITSRYKRSKLTHALDVLSNSGVFPRDVHMHDFLHVRLRDLSSGSDPRIANHDKSLQHVPRKRWRRENKTDGAGTQGVFVTEMTHQTATRLADTLIAISDALVASENLHNDLHRTQKAQFNSPDTQPRVSVLLERGAKIQEKIASLPFLDVSEKRPKGPVLTYDEGLEYARVVLLPLPSDIGVLTAIASYGLALSDTAQQLHYELIHKPTLENKNGVTKRNPLPLLVNIMKYYR